MAIMIVILELSNDLEKGDYIIGIFIELPKGFQQGRVNYDILLDKLYNCDVKNKVHEKFRSYT